MNFGVATFNRLLTALIMSGGVGCLIPSVFPEVMAEGTQSQLKSSQASAEFTVAQLLHVLSLNPIRQVQFDETYYSDLLASPIKKSGWLSYAPPSKFEKHIETPSAESFVVERDTLKYTNRAQEVDESLSLEEYPPLQVFIEGLRSIFSGDLLTLKKYYRPEIEGTQSQWELHMVPREEQFQESVKVIRFRGRDDQIEEIEIHEANGNRSTLVLREF